MALRNTSEHYGTMTKTLHWITSIGVIVMLIVGSQIDRLRNISYAVYDIHKTLGMTLLVLMLFFVLWSAINPKPKYPDNMTALQLRLAHLVRILLYALVIAMGLLGWFFTTAGGKPPSLFGLASLPMPFVPLDKTLAKTGNFLHLWTAWALTGVIALHLLGALVHHFVKKDNVLKRMLGRD